jgi:ABC-type multidrug transport system ATPase subunit
LRASEHQQVSVGGFHVYSLAGKTTFLNVLSGKANYGRLSGLIRFNGEHMEPTKVATLVGYVPQDDIVHEDLTVYENIMMARALRGGFKELGDRKAIVDQV